MKIRPFILLILTALTGLLFSTAPLEAQVVSNDTNFTPAVLKSGLSVPSGVVFRASPGDLVVSQTGANQVSLVNAGSGAMTSFATQPSADEVAVRSSDGLVAVKTQVTGQTAGPIDFYDSTGVLLGSIPQGTPDGCITGMAFDASGNLFVAAGPATEVPGGCLTTGWALYEFQGATPWTATPSSRVTFSTGDLIEGLAFNPTPLPSGSFYAVSSANGNIYQIFLCPDCSFDSRSLVATVPTATDLSGNPHPGLAGVAIDPLLGDVYITEFGGTDILRMPPPPPNSDPPPTVFATGFSNTFGISFDSNGNLYVNESNNGNLWKFTRNAFATPPQQIVQGQTMTFTNPNPSMSDQVQTMFIPQSAGLNGAATISLVFVPTSPATLNARLAQGSSGDSNFFGGGGITAGSTCVTVPSAGNNCLVTVQKCFKADGSEQAICTVREPFTSTDLIQLTSSYANPLGAPPAHFAIDFDTPSNNNSATDITTQVLDCCTGSGGTKSLCSQTYFFVPGASGFADFSIGPISPSPITVASGGSSSATVPVKSINSFNSPVTLSVSDAPGGITATLNQASVTPAPNLIDTSTTLTVSVGSSFDSATTTANIATVIANLLASGCIDNSGIANALTSKLSTAQAALNGGQIKTAVNTLTAFKSQVQAQAGKHIGTSCTTTFTLIVNGQAFGITHLASASVSVTSLNAASILLADASSLIGQLSVVTNGDPITGFVVNSGFGVPGSVVSILNGSSTVATATTDSTGFYYFPNTSNLANGVAYTIQVTGLAGFTTSVPSSSTFTWMGKGMAFNFTLN